jgi:hypothetical protein
MMVSIIKINILFNMLIITSLQLKSYLSMNYYKLFNIYMKSMFLKKLKYDKYIVILKLKLNYLKSYLDYNIKCISVQNVHIYLIFLNHRIQ